MRQIETLTRTWICLGLVMGVMAAGCAQSGGDKKGASANESSASPPPAPAQPSPAPAPPAEPSAAKRPGPIPTDAVEGAASVAPGAAAVPTKAAHPGLLDPTQAVGQAPDEYAVKFSTTKGDFIIDVHRAWAPIGADRFYNLVRVGYFDDVAFFRVVEGFMAQVGIHGDPRVNAVWRNQRIQDDPVTQSNQRGYVSFATSGPDSRVNQFFINTTDNARLDPMGFAPFGQVRDMKVVDTLYAGYGEAAPVGRGPSQHLMQMSGNAYLKAKFPELDYVRTATIVE